MKRCPKCGETKPATLEFFYAGKKWRDGFKPYCKVCQIRLSHDWAKANPMKIAAHRKQQRIKKPEYYSRIRTEWKNANPDNVKSHRRREYEKFMQNPTMRLKKRMRRALRNAIGGTKHGRSWESILGFSPADLRRHIERQFQPGMSWENMGEWHIDHIIPVSSFSYVDEHDREFKACWALANLAPRWARDNMKKGAKRLYLI